LWKQLQDVGQIIELKAVTTEALASSGCEKDPIAALHLTRLRTFQAHLVLDVTAALLLAD
jgi:hypothetical protein